MFRVSKGLTIILSLTAIMSFYLLIKLKNIKYGIAFTIFVSLINLTVFTERFLNTRYKYYTIVQAAEYYIEELSAQEGVVGYSDESGVESWYLRNYEKDFYDALDGDPHKWIKDRNVKYYIYTDEMGDNSKREKNLKNFMDKFSTVNEFRSPSVGGYTKIVEIDIDT
jgi:hypothetical protein